MAKGLLKKIISKDNSSDKKDSIEINSDEIIAKIQEGYEKKNRSGVKKRVGFTPSSLTYGAGKCPRFWYLWFEGNEAKSNNDWYSIANMDSGSDRHERIEEAMENAGILISKEMSIKNEYPIISAKTDAVINWNGMELLTEIKTVNEDSFERLNKPRNYNIEQVLIYMKILKKSIAYLIYESKNSHRMKMYPIKLNDKYKDFMEYFWNWMIEVQSAFDNKQLPENPYRNKYNSKICKGCDFLEACQSKPEGDIKIAYRKDLE